ncbi:hypothetical protein TVNIR_2131 [Thioalkalivibrio nitratireducens DSM 14787]|uniref:Uncharacterized protein n=1 Tax=Thioalkalivibrio nitratireducens (strain DSM 14787 / UNIQEM 213 / ALEN2) TaxID=1255043 RepID=L0DW17_THIND|nr:hypothetical protein [Thioalkalivibrio nitratireducens]AGA33789.1 hypothetical protein TVNIR_2131 [Thioalkalivibrio nitratireducens DSM 14787]
MPAPRWGVVVDRLRLRGQAPDLRAVAAQVEAADWPQRRDWVIVRRIEVRAPLGRLARRLGEATDAQIAQSVSPGSAGADRAAAIRFVDRADLLAWLSEDLARGRAATRWYWQHWRHLFGRPPPRALATLWQDDIAHLPAVTARLAERGVLATVWQALDAGTAEGLVAAYARHAGVPLAPAANMSPQAEVTHDAGLPPTLLGRWMAVLREWAPGDPRVTLAALLVALEWQPIRVVNQPAARLQLVCRALRPPVPFAPPPPPADDRATPAEPGLPGSAHVARSGAGAPHAGTGPAQSEQPGAAPRRGDAPKRRSGEPRIAEPDTTRPGAPAGTPAGSDDRPELDAADVPRRRGAHRASRGSALPHPAAPGPSPPLAAETLRPDAHAFTQDEAGPEPNRNSLQTGQGGLFYLVNVLEHPQIRRWLEQRQAWQALPDGWLWMFRLGRELDFDPEDPLAHFLAGQAGLNDPAALENAPELPHRRELLAQIVRVYRELWNPDLLAVPGRLVYTESHLDLQLPLQAVRLPVRLAGLDVNPGWVPWLGRVVTFIYTEAAK